MTDLEALKARHPILEVARDLGLEVNHNRFRCPHPERHTHGDRTASVTLWPDRNLFKCWVCPDVKGDVLNLIQVVKGIGFAEAVAFLEKRGGYSPTLLQAQGIAHKPTRILFLNLKSNYSKLHPRRKHPNRLLLKKR